MFENKKRTIIAEGIRIKGIVSSDGEVEIRGSVEGELDCSSVTIAKTGFVTGSIKAETVSVDGKVEGPIDCNEIVFNSNANVIGDVECGSVVVEKGAIMDGHLRRRPSRQLGALSHLEPERGSGFKAQQALGKPDDAPTLTHGRQG